MGPDLVSDPEPVDISIRILHSASRVQDEGDSRSPRLQVYVVCWPPDLQRTTHPLVAGSRPICKDVQSETRTCKKQRALSSGPKRHVDSSFYDGRSLSKEAFRQGLRRPDEIGRSGCGPQDFSRKSAGRPKARSRRGSTKDPFKHPQVQQTVMTSYFRIPDLQKFGGLRGRSAEVL